MGIDTKLKLRIGICLVEMNQMDAALEKLEPYEDAEPEACLYTGRIYLGRGDYAVALKKLNSYIERVGENEQATYYLACALAGSNLKRRRPDYSSAVQAFERVIALQGKYTPRAHLQLGKIYQSLDKREQAQEHFQACSGHSDTRLEASLGLAYLYFSSGKITEARALLASLQKSYAQDPRLLGLLGMAAELEGDYAGAEQAYTQANETAALGVVLYRQGRTAEALKCLEKARAAGDTSDRTLYFSGQAYVDTGNLTAALQAWEILYNRHPKDETLGWNIARVCYRQGCAQLDSGAYDQAAEAWEQYYRHASTDPVFVSSLAQVYLRIAAQKPGTEDAAAALKRARELGISEAECLSTEGFSLLGSGDLYRAAAKLEEYLRFCPEDASGHYNTGLALLRIGQKASGVEHLQQAYALGDAELKQATAWALAAVSAEEDDWQAAVLFIPAGSVMNPWRTLLQTAALLKTGQADQAAAVAAAGQSAGAHLLLAAALAASGQDEPAIIEYELALKIEPDHQAARDGAAAAYANRAVVAARNQDWNTAQAALDRALALSPGQESLLRLQEDVQRASGLKGLNLDSLETAISALEKVQRDDPCRFDVAHQLAILNHRRAIQLEESPRVQERSLAWNKAFANWALVLQADEYWKLWAVDRQQVYQMDIHPGEIEKLRGEVIRGRIRELHNQYMQMYFNDGKPGEVSRHRRCVAQWGLEWNTARAVRETIRFLNEKGVRPKVTVASGPLFWEQYRMRTAVTQMADDALRLDADFQPAKTIRDALSPTGLAKMLLEEAQVDDCIELLEEHLHTNPGDAQGRALMAKAYLAKMRAQAGSDPRGAIASAEKAHQYGANKVETEEIIYVAAMEAAGAAVKAGRFEEAEKILHEVMQIMPGRKPLQEKYAEVVCARVDAQLSRLQAEAGQGGDLDGVIQQLLEAKQTLEAVEPVAGAGRPHVQRELEKVKENGTRYCQQRASQLDFQGTALTRKGYNEYQAGNRAQARQTWQEAKAALERAKQLDPDSRSIEQNLRSVCDYLAKLG